MTANDTQIGGSHYKVEGTIQPWEIIDANGLNYYEGNVLKYLLRHRLKNGVEDLRKCQHYLEKLIEVEKGKGKQYASSIEEWRDKNKDVELQCLGPIGDTR